MPSSTLRVVFDPESPVGRHGNQRLDFRIVPGTGVPPVRRVTHVAPLHGVLVDVFQLLPQHRLAPDDLRMTPFLPELERAVALVPGLVVLQAVEQGPYVTFAEVVDDTPRRVGLEIANLPRQV